MTVERWILAGVCMVGLLAGCGTGQPTSKGFFTSGSREADQRAEQRIASSDAMSSKSNAQQALQGKQSLFDRLGGDAGISKIVDDFVTRTLADPRVNWERYGVTKGGFLGMGKKSAQWNPDEQHVTTLKVHMRQFFGLATGGPSQYEGRDIENVHKGMAIDNPEFDAVVGDLKATLDKMHVGVDEQKELLAIVESTRPQIVEKR